LIHLSTYTLLTILFFLILLSGFFSGSETGMMSVNRYRLRHLVREKHRGAKRVQSLLSRPDRLLGVILIGNTFANILASAIATILAVRLIGDVGIALATVLLTFVILIFAEVAPKTVAAIYSLRFAFLVSWPLKVLLTIFYPLVWFVNLIANGFLFLFGVRFKDQSMDHLSPEELRTLVNEAGGRIPSTHQSMLLKILDLEKVTVDDIMVPRSEIVGLDLDDDWDDVMEVLTHSQHTRMPVYRLRINI